MQKFKNTNFLKDLIDSDFSVINLSDKKKQTNSKLRLKLDISKNLEILNVLDLNKNLKQFIRSIQELTKNSNSSIYIWVEHFSTVELLEQLFEKINISTKIEIKTTAPSFKENSKSIKLVLILGIPLNCSIKDISYNLFKNNIFLLNKINFQIENNLYGSYKIFNDLNDLKKILFLTVIINQILINSNKNEKI